MSRTTATATTTPAWLLAALLHPPEQRDLDALLERTARALQAEGWRVGGLVARQGRYPNGSKRMQLLDVRTQALHDISQNRGLHASGCRLDSDGLLRAGSVLRQALQDGVDVLVINRFGVSEGEGKGFAAEFAQAVQAGVPVITAVTEAHVSQWQRFTGGEFESLPHDADALLALCRARLSVR